MYNFQALRTQARERLDLITVIFANRYCAIQNVEPARVCDRNVGPRGLSMFDLINPELNFVKLAEGLRVEARRAETQGPIRGGDGGKVAKLDR